MNVANRNVHFRVLCNLYRYVNSVYFYVDDIFNAFQGPFPEGPEKFSRLKSHSKISNPLMTTELFYAHILNMNRGTLHTRSFTRIHFSISRYR